MEKCEQVKQSKQRVSSVSKKLASRRAFPAGGTHNYFQKGGFCIDVYKSKATASMVLGIVSVSLLALSRGLALPALVCAIVGLVLAIQIRKAAKLEGFELTSNAKAGYVLGIIGLVLNALVLVACAACAAALTSDIISGRFYNIPNLREFFDQFRSFGNFGNFGDFGNFSFPDGFRTY